jgi:hypothetical protein
MHQDDQSSNHTIIDEPAVKYPPIRVLSALYRHGRKDALWDGRSLFRFGEREWSAARRKTRVGRIHRDAFLVVNAGGIPVRSGYHPSPFLALYLEQASSPTPETFEGQRNGV